MYSKHCARRIANRQNGRRRRDDRTVNLATAVFAFFLCWLSAAANAATISFGFSGSDSSSFLTETEGATLIPGVGIEGSKSGVNYARAPSTAFSQFDPTLGTLNRVIFNFTGIGRSELRRQGFCESFVIVCGLELDIDTQSFFGYDVPGFSSGAIGPPGGSGAFFPTADVTTGSQLDAFETYLLVAFDTDAGAPRRTTASSGALTLFAGVNDLSPYIGFGSVSIRSEIASQTSVSILCSLLSACQGGTRLLNSFNYTGSVTYDYEPFDATVPVPAAAILFVTGFTAAAGATFRRRRDGLQRSSARVPD